MLQNLSNSMEIKSSISNTFVPNLKEIEAQEDGFSRILKIFLFWCEEKEITKKIGQFLRANIL